MTEARALCAKCGPVSPRVDRLGLRTCPTCGVLLLERDPKSGKPILDISKWTKVRIHGVACVVCEGIGLVPISEFMRTFEVIDYKIVNGVRMNPSGEPSP